MSFREGPLGRRVPASWEHVERFPLSAHPSPPEGVPVVLGISWYTNFDRPERDGNHWWIGRGSLGTVRGGHCVCVPAYTTLAGHSDLRAWWEFYDQGAEGACVGFGSSRCMSLLNRRRYNARWLWDHAKEVDEWPDTRPGDDNGTSVRAAFDVLRAVGHVRWEKWMGGLDQVARDAQSPRLEDGVSANRWATSVEEILTTLANPRYATIGGVPILNSWGRGYPHTVWMTLDALGRVLAEDGEATILTDR